MKYPIELPDVIAKKRQYSIDKNDIIIEKIPYTNFYAHNPTMIACAALRYDHEPSIKWLINHMDEDGAIRHHYQSEFSPAPGWVGGLSQALAAYALMKYGYEEEGQKAIDAMLKYSYQDGFIFERPNQLILNGWIYGIISLYEAGRFNHLQEALEKLEKTLHLFDRGYWSSYDATWLLATPFYHHIHCEQLKYLGDEFDNDVFTNYSRKWYVDARPDKAKRIRRGELIKRHGLLGVIKQYQRRKKWLKQR